MQYSKAINLRLVQNILKPKLKKIIYKMMNL